jgi:hypothetical protein
MPLGVRYFEGHRSAVLVPEYNNQVCSQMFNCTFDAAQSHLIHYFSSGANDKNVAYAF